MQAVGTHTGVLVILLALTLIVAEGTSTAKSGADGEQSRQNEKSTLDFVQSLLDMEDRGRVQPVEGSRLVHEIDSAKLVLVERHSDGGTLIPGRSTGVFDVQPYVTVTTRRGTAADPLGMRVEWKVGNCLVGPDLAFTVAFLDDEPIGSCWSPHCYVNLSSPARGGGGVNLCGLAPPHRQRRAGDGGGGKLDSDSLWPLHLPRVARGRRCARDTQAAAVPPAPGSQPAW